MYPVLRTIRTEVPYIVIYCTLIYLFLPAYFFSSPSKSPSKRKRDSIALLNLDEELKKAADAQRRTSDYINSANEAEERDADHEHNLASIVASLR